MGLDKRFVKKNNDGPKKVEIHQQGLDAPLGGRTITPGGEIADDGDPESKLIAKEEEQDGEDVSPHTPLSAAENRARIAHLQLKEAEEEKSDRFREAA